MNAHLAAEAEQEAGNHRHGSSQKTVRSEDTELMLPILHGRNGRFDPTLTRKYPCRFPSFDQKIVALYARGMNTQDIQAHSGELYGASISPDLVSVVINSVIGEVCSWQSRPLESTYAIGSLMHYGWRSAMRAWSATRPFTWRSVCGYSGHKEVLGL